MKMTTFYVSIGGRDSADGFTEKTPIRTIDELNRRLAGMDGVRTLFDGGQTHKGNLRFENQRDISIGGYGIGVPTISCGMKSGIVFDNCRGINVCGIRVQGAGWRNTAGNSAIEGADCSMVAISNVEVCEVNYAGINFEHSSDVTYTGCYAHDCGGVGLRTGGANGRSQNALISHCRVYDIPGDRRIMGNHSGSGIIIDGTEHALVEFCEAAGTGWGQRAHSSCGPVGIWACCGCVDVVFRYCVARDNRTQPGSADGDGFDFDGGVKDGLMEYCYSYGNEAAGFFFCEYGAKYYDPSMDYENNTVRACVSFDDARRTKGYAALSISTPPGYPLGKITVENNLLVADDGANAVDNRIMPDDNGEVIIRDNVMVVSGADTVKERGDTHTVIESNNEIDDGAVARSIRTHAPRITDPRALPSLPVFELLDSGRCADALLRDGVTALFGEAVERADLLREKGKEMFTLRMDGLDFDGCDRNGDATLYYDSMKPGVCTRLGAGGRFMFPLPWWEAGKSYALHVTTRIISPMTMCYLYLLDHEGNERRAYINGTVTEYTQTVLSGLKLNGGAIAGVGCDSGVVYVECMEFFEVSDDINVSDTGYCSFGDCEDTGNALILHGAGSMLRRTMDKPFESVGVELDIAADGEGNIVLASYDRTKTVPITSGTHRYKIEVESPHNAAELYIQCVCGNIKVVL